MRIVCILPIAIVMAAGAAETAPESDPAGALEFFVGSCWQGVFADGETTDTHCFRPVYGGQFIRDNHVVVGTSGRYAGETLYRWNAVERRFDYTYWDSTGGVSRGSLEPDGAALRSPTEEYVDADGVTRVIASVWSITGADSWQQSAEEVRGDGTIVPVWTVRYRRIDAQAAAGTPCLAPCEDAP